MKKNENKKKKKDYYKLSLIAHAKNGGKISIVSKMKIVDKDDLSIAYTPGVAEVCREIYKVKSNNNKDNKKNDFELEQTKKYTLKKNTIAVVSDGSAVLGLGNIGANAAIPVMEGKAVIMKAFAGVDAFPICVNTQDTEEIIDLIKNIAPVFGGINLEDIQAPKCFEIEERLKKELDIPVMHDDQWGAGVVALAGLINAIKLAKKDLNKCIVVVSGVGAAGVATIKLIKAYAKDTKIIAVDSVGIISKNRRDIIAEENKIKNKIKLELINEKIIYSEINGTLEDAFLKADIFIGLSKPDLVNEKMIKNMSINPIIFALSNPAPEIMPELAYQAGAFIVGTGRSDYPNQINNSVFFPGFWRGMLDRKNNDKNYDLKMLIKVAEVIAKSVKKLNKNNILPSTLDKKIHKKVANFIKNY